MGNPIGVLTPDTPFEAEFIAAISMVYDHIAAWQQVDGPILYLALGQEDREEPIILVVGVLPQGEDAAA